MLRGFCCLVLRCFESEIVRAHRRIATFLALALLSVPGFVAAATPSVAVSIAPLYSLVAAVMKDVGPPQLIMPGSASPHAWSMRPSHARAIAHADLIVWVGPTLETALARSLLVSAKADDAGRQLALLELPGLQVLSRRQEYDDHDGHAHEGHGHHDDGDQGSDPHIWLNPDNAKVIVAAVSNQMVQLDPDNAAIYERNALQVTESLAQLGRELQQALQPLQGERLAVYHDAYQYLETFVGLGESVVITTDPDQPRGVGQISRLASQLQNVSVPCLFTEPQFDGRLVGVLAERNQLQVKVLDPLGSEIEPGIEAYQQMMRELASVMLACKLGAPN